jgi:hypothetical protein
MLIRSSIAALAAALVTAASASAAIPDPLQSGPDGYQKIEYDAGSIMLSAPNINGSTTAAFQQELAGALFVPTGDPGPWPAVVVIHGNHSNCITQTGTEMTTPTATCKANGGTPILNYEGYDYFAANLASHGYVVMSLDADDLTAGQTSQDNGTFLRTQLISASLDLLYAWEDGTAVCNQGVTATCNVAQTVGTKLTGKVEIQRGVGIIGHSRGGEAASSFPLYNRLRPGGGRKYRIDAALAIAPVDYERAAVYGTGSDGVSPWRTAYATILPLCDGDVSNVQGARIYMNSLHAATNDPSPKIQWDLQGTDHDYSNTIWSNDDGSQYLSTAARPDAACGEDVPGNIRLSPTDQRDAVEALVGAFIRRYVGGETAFESLMTGASGLPSSACPTARGVSCSEELKTSYFAPAAQRRDVLLPDPNTALTTDALGGALTGTGFQNPYPAGTGATAPTTPQGFDWCNPEPIEFRVTSGLPTAAKPCPLPPAGTLGVLDPAAFGGQANERELAPVNRSYGPQLALAWSGPAELDTAIPSSASDESTFANLAMDVAVNYFDPRNPPSGPGRATDPRAAVQDFDVRLTDAAGHTATVAAANLRYGTALETSLGTARRHILLNELRIPLTDFAGVDLHHVRQVALVFGARTTSGSIELANMRFQEPLSPAASDPVIGPGSPAPVPTAAASTASPMARLIARANPITLAGATAVADPRMCSDHTAPHATLSSLQVTRTGLVVGGRAFDLGCKATATRRARAGRVAQVQVAVARTAAGRCRYLGAARRLLPASSCGTVVALVARGRSRFSLKVATRLPAGRYRVRVQVIDAAGNLTTGRARTVTVR